ncbi:phospholipid scramblase 2-like [Tribolium madens]|uniref:phospholipid scramblase 2-like n=1 Tax=Tribolium madens TaxID=41895 RepID=UPI001CF745B7|nr:phospholipid scramblase 2-like [Tribolium madens]
MAGLEQLAKLDQLILRMNDESSETQYKISMENSAGQKLFYFGKVSGRFRRNFSLKPFNLKIIDNFKNEVIHLHRPCCSCSWGLSLEVLAPPGTFVGKIEEKCSFCSTKFGIRDETGKKVFTIKGPICICSCRNIKFKVLSADGKTQVGIISNQADTKCLRLSFLKNMDVGMKAVMVAASLLIFAMVFDIDIDQLWQNWYPQGYYYVPNPVVI